MSAAALSSPLSLPLSGPLAWPLATPGLLHEVHCPPHGDAAALAFALMGATNLKPVLLVRLRSRPGGRRLLPCGAGLAELGFDPARLLVVAVADGRTLLRVGHEGARCAGLAAVLCEAPGHIPEYTLTASRRLVLAAEKSGVVVVMLRGAAAPRASAAHRRWQVAAVPGGMQIELARTRGGGVRAGQSWRLEWSEEDGVFREINASMAHLKVATLFRPAPQRISNA